MNIFVLDKDPYKAASYLCDAHVVKMIVESCQLLSAADITIYGKPQEGRYLPGWKNHPCCKCLSNKENYEWLIHHLMGLLYQYNIRYNRVHSCKEMQLKYWFRNSVLYEYIDHSKLTFPKCVGNFWEEGNDIDTVVKVYRNYYKYKRDTLSRFNYRLGNIPEWLKEN